VEHLTDARQRWLPGPNIFHFRCPRHARRTYKTCSQSQW
jgi:hypothetical protein